MVERLEEQLQRTQLELQTQSEAGNRAQTDLQRLRQEHAEVLHQHELGMRSAVAARAEEAARALEAAKEQHTSDLLQQQQRSEALISQLQTRLEEATAQNKVCPHPVESKHLPLV